jgi:hypothetical protein
MAPTTPDAYDDRPPAARVLALPELWVIVAEHSGVVGAWRLMGVCRASREGAKEWLRTLPGLVVCGGYTGTVVEEKMTSEVWRLDLGELRWEHTSDLALGRGRLACCAVRGGIVVLGEQDTWFVRGENEAEDCITASVEVLGYDSEAEEKMSLPPLSCAPFVGAAAVAIDESESEQGHVLHIGGGDGHMITSAVQKVDLATGECTRFLLSFLVGDRFARLRSCQTGASFA